jgi:hypothetical protein
MKKPPLIMKLSIPHENGTIRIWLPLFLIYPIIAVIVIILAPIVIIAALIFWPLGMGKTVLLFGPYLYNVLCAVVDLEINIEKVNRQFSILFK